MAPALLILNLISHILSVWHQGKIILEDSKHSSLQLEFPARLLSSVTTDQVVTTCSMPALQRIRGTQLLCA